MVADCRRLPVGPFAQGGPGPGSRSLLDAPSAVSHEQLRRLIPLPLLCVFTQQIVINISPCQKKGVLTSTL